MSEREKDDRPQADDRVSGEPEQAGERPVDEEELRARLAEELRRIKVRDVLLQTVVTLVNLGGQRLGLTEDTEEMRDLDQVRLAIESLRALLPLLSEQEPEQVRPVRDALAQLQMAYAQAAAEGGAGTPGAESKSPGGDVPDAPSGAGQRRTADSDKQESPDSGQPRRKPPGGLWVPPGSVG